jgi:hypothetical protein
MRSSNSENQQQMANTTLPFAHHSNDYADSKNSSEAVKTAFNAMLANTGNQSLNHAIQKLINKQQATSSSEDTTSSETTACKKASNGSDGLKLEPNSCSEQKSFSNEHNHRRSVFDFCAKFFENNVAACVPFFHAINNQDQCRLLENSWLELLITCLSESKIPVTDSYSDSDSPLSELLENSLRTIKCQVDKIRRFDLSREEYSYLRGLVFHDSSKFDYYIFYNNCKLFELF